MNSNVLRSIGAVAAGMVAIVVLSYGTDFVLEGVGVLPRGRLYGSWLLIVAVLVYRCLYSVIGCYIAARLAPGRPMRHALSLGVLGLIVSAAGTAATWNMHLAPAWYSLALIVLALPCAWVGGKPF